GMAGESQRDLGRGEVTQPDGAVLAGRRQGLAVRSDSDREAATPMALVGKSLLARRHVPQLDQAIDRARGQRLAVGGEGQGLNRLRVAGEGGQFLARGGVEK